MAEKPSAQHQSWLQVLALTHRAIHNGPVEGRRSVHGMGKKLVANPVTGTMTVPATSSPRRSGFSPQLFISYDSGSGNGPLGLPLLLLTRVTGHCERGPVDRLYSMGVSFPRRLYLRLAAPAYHPWIST